MKINTKTRYGMRAIMELAQNKTRQVIHQKDISENQGISYKYLDQIIAGLKSSGLTASVSGKKSGYRLTRDPEQITVYDIYTAFNPELAIVECLSGEGICAKDARCASRDFWTGLNSVIVNYLKSTTINDLVGKQDEINIEQEGLIYHI